MQNVRVELRVADSHRVKGHRAQPQEDVHEA
jgi:hypothetical protein